MFALCFITLAVLVFGVWVFTSHDKYLNKSTVNLSNGDEVNAELGVDLGSLYPGASLSYTFNLKANKGDGFNITASFIEKGPTTIKEYVNVEIRLNGERIDSDSLNAYLGGKTVNFRAEFGNTNLQEVELIYTMSAEVGDEAQGATADFDINISAKR